MGWFDKLTSAVRSVGSAVRNGARKVVEWAAAGIGAVASFAKKTVLTVKNGWKQVKEKLKSADTKARERIAVLERKKDRAIARLREAEQSLAVEVARRRALVEKDRAEVARLEEGRRKREQLRKSEALAQERFLRDATEIVRDLRRLLGKEQLTDFDAFARLSLAVQIIGHLITKATTLDGWLSLSEVEHAAARAIRVLTAATVSEGESAYHLDALDRYCRDTFGQSLVVQAAVSFFEPYNRELWDAKEREQGGRAEKNEAERRIRILDAKRRVEGPLSEREAKQASRLVRQVQQLEQTLEQLVQRQDRLVVVTGVNEGLICVISGDEDDNLLVEDAAEVGEILAQWRSSGEGALDPEDVAFLKDFAACYQARARERTNKLAEKRQVDNLVEIAA